jgi:3-oxoacyl-ACP reductase-like protein
VSENGVLRRIFGSKRDVVTGEWRKLHYEKLNGLYFSLNIVRVIKSRRIRWQVHVARMGERRDVNRVLVGKRERKRPLGRPRHRWEDNIKKDLQKVGCVGMGWIELTQNRDR